MKRNWYLTAAAVFVLSSMVLQAQIRIGRGGISIGGSGGSGGVTIGSGVPDNVDTNPDAPGDYDADLKEGDSAIAVNSHYGIYTVKILDKSSGAYKTMPVNATEWEIKNKNGTVRWYKANSVYPYYDAVSFRNDMRKYEQYLKHYIECYAKKIGVPLEKLTGTTSWSKYYLADADELNLHRKMLDELNTLLTTKYQNAPNTFLKYADNPYIWQQIAKDREEYIKCLLANPNDNIERSMKMMLGEIAEAKKQVSEFNGTNDLYRGGSLEWIWRAVSQKRRQEFIDMRKDLKSYKEFAAASGNTSDDPLARLNSALDDLKEAVAPKLSQFKINTAYFKYRDAASESVMKNYLKNPSSLKIHKIGLGDGEWLIAKNDIGFPLYRYKRGTMLVRNPSDDHPYCKGLFFVVKQEYSGAGTYGGSTISEYHEELYGCP